MPDTRTSALLNEDSLLIDTHRHPWALETQIALRHTLPLPKGDNIAVVDQALTSKSSTAPVVTGTDSTMSASVSATSAPGEGEMRTKPTEQQRHKEVKDAPKFERGPTVCAVNFPPFVANANDESLRQHLQNLEIYPPTNQMAEFPRHIPYSGNKVGLQAVTGRGSFEVFQYIFKFNHKVFVVMWDYNIGLVRITPFFKALGCNKTAPAKAIKKTPGLRELCHSITGGALAAQGYWMPFPAARALAATFCYDIRYALVPLFGTRFPSSCVMSDDPAFYKFNIDEDVIMACKIQLQDWALAQGQPNNRNENRRLEENKETLDDEDDEETWNNDENRCTNKEKAAARQNMDAGVIVKETRRSARHDKERQGKPRPYERQQYKAENARTAGYEPFTKQHREHSSHRSWEQDQHRALGVTPVRLSQPTARRPTSYRPYLTGQASAANVVGAAAAAGPSSSKRARDDDDDEQEAEDEEEEEEEEVDDDEKNAELESDFGAFGDRTKRRRIERYTTEEAEAAYILVQMSRGGYAR